MVRFFKVALVHRQDCDFVGRAGLEPATMAFCYAPAPYHQRKLYLLSYRPMVPGFRRARLT